MALSPSACEVGKTTVFCTVDNLSYWLCTDDELWWALMVALVVMWCETQPQIAVGDMTCSTIAHRYFLKLMCHSLPAVIHLVVVWFWTPEAINGEYRVMTTDSKLLQGANILKVSRTFREGWTNISARKKLLLRSGFASRLRSTIVPLSASKLARLQFCVIVTMVVGDSPGYGKGKELCPVQTAVSISRSTLCQIQIYLHGNVLSCRFSTSNSSWKGASSSLQYALLSLRTPSSSGPRS